MLRTVAIENYGLFEKQTVELQGGFTVITGESGSGKTLFIDAIALALGDRWDPSRKGPLASRTRVTLGFEVGADHPVWGPLAALGLEPDDILLVQREVREDRSVFRVQGQAVPAQAVRDIRERLWDVTSQHAAVSLAHRDTMRRWLDRFGGLELAVAAVAAAYHRYVEAEKVLEQWDTHVLSPEYAEELETVVRQLAELAPEPGEDEVIREEIQRLRAGQRLMEHYDALSMAWDNEATGGLRAQWQTIARELEAMAALDADLAPVREMWIQAELGLQEVETALQRWWGRFDLDHQRLEWLEARSDALARLKRRFGPTLEEVLAYGHKAQARLTRDQDSAWHRRQQRQECEQLKAALMERCQALSEARQSQAQEAARRVTEVLHQLEMPEAQLIFALESKAPSSDGIDRVEARLGGVPPEPTRTLEKGASGGELARIALAMAAVAGERQLTYVFDEVDAGLGGLAAARVGDLLHRLGREVQVLAISHQPGVAACADHHFTVHKASHPSGVRAVLKAVQAGTREHEVARMLSGRGDAIALQHARSLLEKRSSAAPTEARQ